MAGTKISDATLRDTLKGTESIPLVDTDLPVGRTTMNGVKAFASSGMMTKSQADELYQPKGNYVTQTDLESKDFATKDELGAKLDKSVYDTEKAEFATKTELNGKLDSATYETDKATFALKTELPSTADFATKEELSTKLSGIGLTSIQVVEELPETPQDEVLYIVTGTEA